MIKDKVELKKKKREKIKMRVRKKVRGTAEKPRLTVYKSNKYIYVQAIDDDGGRTIASASSIEKDFREKQDRTKGIEASKLVGEMIAERLISKGIKKVVFDRNGYKYHGKVKALADGARGKGLEF